MEGSGIMPNDVHCIYGSGKAIVVSVGVYHLVYDLIKGEGWVVDNVISAVDVLEVVDPR